MTPGVILSLASCHRKFHELKLSLWNLLSQNIPPLKKFNTPKNFLFFKKSFSQKIHLPKLPRQNFLKNKCTLLKITYLIHPSNQPTSLHSLSRIILCLFDWWKFHLSNMCRTEKHIKEVFLIFSRGWGSSQLVEMTFWKSF